ncbi:MAG: hypothetical protein ACR2KJ_03840 [Jatrophihabitans sp.]
MGDPTQAGPPGWATPADSPPWPPLGAVPQRRRRGKRRLFVAAAAVVVLAAGGTVGVLALVHVDSSTAVVADYFRALQNGDAAKALSLGTAPTGDSHLLTSTVLRGQQKVAPIEDFRVVSSSGDKRRSRVAVSYRIGGPGPVSRNETITLHRKGKGWELDRTSSLVTVQVGTAAHRITIGGGAIPSGAVRMFPGLVPVQFDTPALQADGQPTVVSLATDSDAEIDVRLSAAGQKALGAGVDAAAQRCLASFAASVLCSFAPEQSRAVPGTLRGTISTQPSADAPSYRLDPKSADGLVTVSGSFMVNATWTSLDFENQPKPSEGLVRIDFRAQLYVSRPGTVEWMTP